MTIADMVGYVATVVGTCVMVPQVVRLVRTKKATDLSIWMVIFYLTNCVLWFTYGYLTKTPPVMLANVIGFLVGGFQLILKVRYRRN